MHKYSYRIHDGHFIFATGSNELLLDTGSPLSIGDDAFEVAGHTLRPCRNLLGVDIRWLRDKVGTAFDALAGMDLLKDTDFYINQEEQWIAFGTDTDGIYGNGLALSSASFVPVVEINLCGQTTRMIFDTGAKVSYLRQTVLTGMQPVGEIADFYPLLGNFTAPVYSLPAEIGGRPVNLQAGALPSLLELTLIKTRAQGILGNDAWAGRNLLFSARENRFVLDTTLQESGNASQGLYGCEQGSYSISK